MIPRIQTADYNYDLPQDRIAQHPLSSRDESKLLIFRNGEFETRTYRDITQYLPANSLMVFNNSKVIPARILFVKETSGVIELFCLEPIDGTPYQALQHNKSTSWVCMVGGLKKWRREEPLRWQLITGEPCEVSASFVQSKSTGHEIEFKWTDPNRTFADVLSELGQMPIPPYLLRKAEVEDQQRYQTVYASVEGSVAAPTAGLHFTDSILTSLHDQQIERAEVTLHVGAGTFKPLTATYAHEHAMHAEWVEADRSLIESLANSNDVICVGTTSLRSVESLFWYALICIKNNTFIQKDFILPQFVAYETSTDLTKKELFTSLLMWMDHAEVGQILFKTELMILPSYQVKVANYLVTNFHQPQSTLLMLVDAFTNGQWKKMYDYALSNNYRFLSYGDGCLIQLITT